MSERNKITELGENINNPLYLQPLSLGRDAPRPTPSKRRGGKSQGKGQGEHGAEASRPPDANQGIRERSGDQML